MKLTQIRFLEPIKNKHTIYLSLLKYLKEHKKAIHDVMNALSKYDYIK